MPDKLAAKHSMESSPDLVLRIGETRSLKFRGLGAAGYSWSWDIEGDQDVIAVKREASQTAPRHKAGGPPPDNYSLDEFVAIKALGRGRIRLHFMLRRPWEKDSVAIDERWITVTVAA